MAVVLLQGPSGVGKTTIGMRLSRDVDTPYISKDTVKEMLFDTIGNPVSRDENYAYGRIAIATIFTTMSECISMGKPLIVDCAFYAKEAAADIQRFAIDSDQVLQVYMTASPETLMSRFNARTENGERHKGHGDVVKDDVGVFAEYIDRYRPLEIANTITVNTDEFDERAYSALRRQVSEFLSSGV